jgi:hypothetical protein
MRGKLDLRKKYNWLMSDNFQDSEKKSRITFSDLRHCLRDTLCEANAKTFKDLPQYFKHSPHGLKELVIAVELEHHDHPI